MLCPLKIGFGHDRPLKRRPAASDPAPWTDDPGRCLDFTFGAKADSNHV